MFMFFLCHREPGKHLPCLVKSLSCQGFGIFGYELVQPCNLVSIRVVWLKITAGAYALRKKVFPFKIEDSVLFWSIGQVLRLTNVNVVRF